MIIPFLITLLLTPFTPYLDKTISSYFYDGHFVTNACCDFFYSEALIPGWIFAGLSVLTLLYKPWRRYALYSILTLLIGAGLITHAMLKDHWGRPRPRQVIEYGGTQEYRPFWKPNFFNQPEPSKSFPCGHCTMGFYFFTLVFIGRRMNRRLVSYAGMALALFLGVGIGLTRIAQGGHFFSDVLFSAFILWYTAAFLDKLLFKETA